MNYMFEKGFLGTGAPFFMDTVTLIVTLLPMVMAFNILLAKKYLYKMHKVMNIFVYILTVIVLGYFEYGVRLGGGFESFSKGSGVSHDYLLDVLVLHIFISVITMLLWSYTLFLSSKQSRVAPKAHKRLGISTFYGIVLTSFSGIWVYMLLFVY